MYYSRKVRFDDVFVKQYQELFQLDREKPLRILEIGCGPGALAGALHHWYPNAEIVGIDRDSAFIQFAQEHEKGIAFMEGDATQLPFDDNSFDVTISNTVSEHIDPSLFYKEQYRVLKPNGICLVLSSRKGIEAQAECLKDSETEKQFWQKVNEQDNTIEQYAIGKYAQNEAQLPQTMNDYGFHHLTTGYVLLDMTPDNPKYSKKFAHAMIQSHCYTELDALNSVQDQVSKEEFEEIKDCIQNKYQTRLHYYNQGIKLWDCLVGLTMVIRGVK